MPRISSDDRGFPYYPAFLDLRHKRVVVVGGGEIATGKVRGLLPCGPEPLIVIAPNVRHLIRKASEAGQLVWHERAYRDGDLADADLVFAATDDRGLNAVVASEARRRRIPVLAVDDIPNCDLIAPSLVKRGNLTIAFSTNGRSPAFARWLRERFDRDVPRHWADLLDVAGTVRDRLGADRARIRPEEWLAALDELDSSMDTRDLASAEEWLFERLRPELPQESGIPRETSIAGEPWEELRRSPLGVRGAPWAGPGEGPKGYPRSRVRESPSSRDASNLASSQDSLTRVPPGPLSQRERGLERSGLVSLVGAGPGDPELLTVRALKRLQEADAVVHDRLIGSEILSNCGPDAELYDVGKSAGHHACQQGEINELLIRLGRSGRRVVRLKGGDPFVFGRGGEEALALAEAGVPFEVVPGVSSALAVPEAVGIPVTHRGMASSVTIATGHGRAASGDADHDWSALARARGTLVFLMAVENLEQIATRLIANGRGPEDPIALIESGTLAEQRVTRATLADAAATARAAGVRAPAVFVVGPTAELADRLGNVFGRTTSDLEAEYREAATDVAAETEAMSWIEAGVDEALEMPAGVPSCLTRPT